MINGYSVQKKLQKMYANICTFKICQTYLLWFHNNVSLWSWRITYNLALTWVLYYFQKSNYQKKNLHVGCWQVSFHLAVLHISFLAPYVICNDPLTLRQTHALRVAKYIPQELNSWVHRIKHKGVNAYITSSIIINYWINIIKRPLAK